MMSDRLRQDVRNFLEDNHLDGSEDSMEKGAEMEKSALGFASTLAVAALLGSAGAGAYMASGGGDSEYSELERDREDKELQGWKKLAPLAAAGVGAYALDQYARGYDGGNEEDEVNPWERSEKLKELEGIKGASVDSDMLKSAFLGAGVELGEGLLLTLPLGIGAAGGYLVGDAMDPDKADVEALMNKELTRYYKDESDKARMRAAELLANQRA